MKIFYAFLACFLVSLYCADDLEYDGLVAMPAQKKLFVFFDRPGGREIKIPVNRAILSTLAELTPGEDRHVIAHQTAIEPATCAIDQMLGSHGAINLESLQALDFHDPKAKGLFIVLACALRLQSDKKDIESVDFAINLDGIKGLARNVGTDLACADADEVSSRAAISWRALNDVCKALSRVEDDVFDPYEMLKIALLIKERKATASQTARQAVVAKAGVDFLKPNGELSQVDLAGAAEGVVRQLANLKPNADRHMLGNQFGLTPAKRFMDTILATDMSALPDFPKLTRS